MQIKEIDYDIQGRKIYHAEYDNGFNCIFVRLKGFNKKQANLCFNYGGNDVFYFKEKKKIDNSLGIAHFLEHKIFEQHGEDAFNQFAKIGAYANAYTSHTSTAYLFDTTNNFYDGLDILFSFLTNPGFTKEGVEKEKDIINQELSMYRDDGDWMVYFNMLNLMYKEHPISHDIVGTKDSIFKISKEELMECYSSFYTSDNSLLTVVGDIDHKELFERVGSLNRFTKGKFLIERNDSYSKKGVNSNYTEYKLPVSKPIFNIGVKNDKIDIESPERIIKSIKINLILDILYGNSSYCFNELWESQLIDTKLNPIYSFGRDYGFSTLSGKTNNPEEVFAKIMETLKSGEKYLNEQKIETTMLKHFSGIMKDFDNPSSITAQVIQCYFNGMDLREYIDRIGDLTISEAKEILDESLNPDNLCVSVILPGLT